jgi:hypothetical protein
LHKKNLLARASLSLSAASTSSAACIEVADTDDSSDSDDDSDPPPEQLNMTAEDVKVNALGYPVLEPAVPVPSDIEISQQICRDVGLLSIQDLAKQ